MVTFEQMVERAKSGLGDDLRQALSLRDDQLTIIVGRIVKSTIDGLGFHISEASGEVCDPRPKSVINYPHDQHGVRWTGQVGRGSRRGGRR